MISIAILLTDNVSISEKIILNSIKYITKKKIKKIYFIGDKFYFKDIFKKTLRLKKFDFFDIKLKKEKNFEYLNKITDTGIALYKEKKIHYLINMPINKKKFFKSKYQGYTEFFSKKIDNKLGESMLMYGNHFSACPLTTHIELKNVDKNITKTKLKKTIKNIISFYKNILKKKKFQIIVLGLNPHASKDFLLKNKDDDILKPVVNYFAKKKINIIGPISADTAFKNFKDKIFLGMYHDQVLIPFKLINKFNGINITLGKGLIRMSPDHGTAPDLTNAKKKVNNTSFLKCIDFCEKYG